VTTVGGQRPTRPLYARVMGALCHVQVHGPHTPSCSCTQHATGVPLRRLHSRRVASPRLQARFEQEGTSPLCGRPYFTHTPIIHAHIVHGRRGVAAATLRRTHPRTDLNGPRTNPNAGVCLGALVKEAQNKNQADRAEHNRGRGCKHKQGRGVHHKCTCAGLHGVCAHAPRGCAEWQAATARATAHVWSSSSMQACQRSNF
jgi:hypothetical protein